MKAFSALYKISEHLNPRPTGHDERLAIMNRLEVRIVQLELDLPHTVTKIDHVLNPFSRV